MHDGPDLRSIRSQFSALNDRIAFLENAGGSQVPDVVVRAMTGHLLQHNAQLGAGYSMSVAATSTVHEAHQLGADMFGAAGVSQVILGPSTTALLHLLAGGYSEVLKPGDRIVVSLANHEANIGPWLRLKRFGIHVDFIPVDEGTHGTSLTALDEALEHRPKIVCVPHASNILGVVENVREIVKMARAVGAQVVVDGVAFAPHKLMDVEALEADWYVFSAYKVYGPHLAALYGTAEALAQLVGPNHEFIPNVSNPHKWELGGISPEACAGFNALREYFSFLAGEPYQGRSTVVKAFGHMATVEAPVSQHLRCAVAAVPGVTVIGPVDGGLPTVSFVHGHLSADTISKAFEPTGIAIRHGHMYAVRLLESLGICADPGVVRVSAVHYNTRDEVDRFLAVLNQIVSS